MTDYLEELISGESRPDYLLEKTQNTLEIILATEIKELRDRLFEGHRQQINDTKAYLRKEHITAPDPKMVDDFLRDFYAYINGLDCWFRDGVKNKKPDSEKLLELENQREDLFNRECVLYRAQQTKHPTQELSDKQAAGGPKKDEVELQPLTPKARAIYEKLCSLKPYEAMPLPEIQKWFLCEYQKNVKTRKDLDEGDWKDIRRELLPYGLKNKPRIGYSIKKNNI